MMAQHQLQTLCTWLQTDSHTSTASLNFYTPGALLDAHQQRQHTEGKLLLTTTLLYSACVICLGISRAAESAVLRGRAGVLSRRGL